jgi:hypothetical protein
VEHLLLIIYLNPYIMKLDEFHVSVARQLLSALENEEKDRFSYELRDGRIYIVDCVMHNSIGGVAVGCLLPVFSVLIGIDPQTGAVVVALLDIR